MKKEISALFCAFILTLILIPSLSAINIEVKKTSSDEVYIKDLNKPIVFYLNITNKGATDRFEFYNLLGFLISPSGKIQIANGETKEIKVEVTSLSALPERGYYTLPYYIKANDGSQVEESITFKILDLKDAFVVGSSDINIESSTAEVYIKNTVNFDFGEIEVQFSSPFYEFSERFSLGPEETKSFTIQLDKEDFKTLTAGFYTLATDLSVEGKTAEIEGVVKFVEKKIVTTTKKDYGFLVNTQIIEKRNEGNIIETSETVIKKNIISRLFTSFSPEPDLVEREGLAVYYTWVEEINPGEVYTITVKTNWLFPFLVILFLIAIVILMKQYTSTNLILNKRVTFVRAKGGEFALKVSIFMSAKKYIERVNVTDRIPALVELYERFGGEPPKKVDKKNKRLEWSFERLNAGETRVLSYIIYSKVGVLGRFALPTTLAVYEKDGEVHETESNHAFFVAEQRTKDIEEE